MRIGYLRTAKTMITMITMTTTVPIPIYMEYFLIITRLKIPHELPMAWRSKPVRVPARLPAHARQF